MATKLNTIKNMSDDELKKYFEIKKGYVLEYGGHYYDVTTNKTYTLTLDDYRRCAKILKLSSRENLKNVRISGVDYTVYDVAKYDAKYDVGVKLQLRKNTKYYSTKSVVRHDLRVREIILIDDKVHYEVVGYDKVAQIIDENDLEPITSKLKDVKVGDYVYTTKSQRGDLSSSTNLLVVETLYSSVLVQDEVGKLATLSSSNIKKYNDKKQEALKKSAPINDVIMVNSEVVTYDGIGQIESIDYSNNIAFVQIHHTNKQISIKLKFLKLISKMTKGIPNVQVHDYVKYKYKLYKVTSVPSKNHKEVYLKSNDDTSEIIVDSSECEIVMPCTNMPKVDDIFTSNNLDNEKFRCTSVKYTENDIVVHGEDYYNQQFTFNITSNNKLCIDNTQFSKGDLVDVINGPHKYKRLKVLDTDNNRIIVKTHIDTTLEYSILEVEHSAPLNTEYPIWKNSKPKQKNNYKLTSDMLAVHNNSEIGSIISKTDNKVEFQTSKNTIELSCEDVYPLYLQESNKSIKIGNIIKVDGAPLQIVTKISDDVIHTSTGNVFSSNEILEVFSKTKLKKDYIVFDCGTIEYNGKEYQSLDELQNQFEHIEFKAKKKSFKKEYLEIAQRFNIDVKDLRPKENDVESVLTTTLNHPLNVAKKRWALLVGGSGTGKTELAVKYCNDNNIEYVKQQGTSQLTVDDIIGYKSLTTGEYVTSLLRDAVENGKVFILDEIDACNPNTLLVLNGLKQEYFQFPDALVKIHENFKLIGTANTLEYSEVYNARAPMDTATRARFKVIQYDMQPHELALRYGWKYIKDIPNIDNLTAREVEGIVIDKKIEEEMNQVQDELIK